MFTHKCINIQIWHCIETFHKDNYLKATITKYTTHPANLMIDFYKIILVREVCTLESSHVTGFSHLGVRVSHIHSTLPLITTCEPTQNVFMFTFFQNLKIVTFYIAPWEPFRVLVTSTFLSMHYKSFDFLLFIFHLEKLMDVFILIGCITQHIFIHKQR